MPGVRIFGDVDLLARAELARQRRVLNLFALLVVADVMHHVASSDSFHLRARPAIGLFLCKLIVYPIDCSEPLVSCLSVGGEDIWVAVLVGVILEGRF